MLPHTSLYEVPASEVTFDLVRRFVIDAEQSDLLAESTTLEFKGRRSGLNIAEAAAALANTDGGLVLVGIADKKDARSARQPWLSSKARSEFGERLRFRLQPPWR